MYTLRITCTISVCILALCCLAACGGGGGDEPLTQEPTTTATAPNEEPAPAYVHPYVAANINPQLPPPAVASAPAH